MKRDMDLVRKILLVLEDNPEPHDWIFDLAIDGYSDKETTYHVQIMAQAGLIEASERPMSDFIHWIPHCPTWAGHEFLDASRDEGRWNKAKKLVMDKTGVITFDAIKLALIELMRRGVTEALTVVSR